VRSFKITEKIFRPLKVVHGFQRSFRAFTQTPKVVAWDLKAPRENEDCGLDLVQKKPRVQVSNVKARGSARSKVGVSGCEM
jgi:hypothetical protein